MCPNVQNNMTICIQANTTCISNNGVRFPAMMSQPINSPMQNCTRRVPATIPSRSQLSSSFYHAIPLKSIAFRGWFDEIGIVFNSMICRDVGTSCGPVWSGKQSAVVPSGPVDGPLGPLCSQCRKGSTSFDFFEISN